MAKKFIQTHNSKHQKSTVDNRRIYKNGTYVRVTPPEVLKVQQWLRS